MEYDPISALQAVGYVEREASFLYLVAVHSGYFLRRQYYSFAGREGGALATRLLGKTLRRRHVQVIECGRGWHIYHLTSKSVYEALNRPDSQHRRIKGDAYIKSRLMVLDFVLAHLNTHVLDSIYTSLEHRVLYSAWMTGSITEDKIRQRFILASLRVSFSTEVLPYRYPIDGFNRRALSHESDKTPSQTHVGIPAVEGNS